MSEIEKEIESLQTELKQLEHQIKNTYEKIVKLKTSKDEFVDELQHQITLARKLVDSLKEENEKTVRLINRRMDSIPDVLDSKPKSYKRPPQPGYSVREGEKWVKIGPDGNMEFEDIEIKK